MANVDLENLQTDVLNKLLSEAYFVDLTVVSLRKLVIESDINAGLVYLTTKAGKQGAGVIVGMPTIEVPSPNVPGPELELKLPVRVMEQPTINQATGGTTKTAEQIAINVLQALHQFQIEGLGALYGEASAIKPNTDTEGVVAYDVMLTVRIPQTAPTFTRLPTMDLSILQVTLTTSESGVTIYKTTDGTFPGSYTGSTATVYTAPFNVASGTTVRWAAYKTGQIGSDAGRALIT